MIIESAIDVLKLEAESILKLAENLDDSFKILVKDICSSTGRVIISGIGKSGLIGRKIAATLSSTGTNAMFLHPVEAVHGDLGMVRPEDVFIAISNSGETSELNQLLPEIRAIGCRLAGFTGNPSSTMAGFCDLVIDTGVEKEACPFNMAPTCSTTVQLAMGDALAVVLINEKNFRKSDFMRSHPGGALGQRLTCRVEEIMFETAKAPCVSEEDPMVSTLGEMDRHRLGAVIVLDREQRVRGIITDGDIRHHAAEGTGMLGKCKAKDIMTEDPHSLSPDAFLYDALNIMEKYQITVLPITGRDNRLQGILHLHDILGKGSFKYNGGS
ncbi:KpsF/GutQ family sugar-phosphate isomerase [Desulfospira joergensenii]|uniref:KpsF/GutQ family sugar-phosphate isomerase n=1 Tax=Desulfospira joergensenii TaxID=53329 RepID=UPI0003B4529C|nr:KpsF/GutQ family sugar-phosphate isomerase [Desulfospira joergensenii]